MKARATRSMLGRWALGVSVLALAVAAVVGLVGLNHASGFSAPAPGTVTLSTVKTGIKVEWAAPSYNEDDATMVGYQIDRGRNYIYTTLVSDTESTATTYTDTSGDPNHDDRFKGLLAYFYRVKAIYEDADGEEHVSSPSPHKTITIPYGPPTDLERVDDESGGVSLSWIPPSTPWGTNKASISGYQLTVTPLGDEGLYGNESDLALAFSDLSFTSSGTTTTYHYDHTSGVNTTKYAIASVWGGIFESHDVRFPDGVTPE